MAEHIIPEAEQLDEASVLADSLLAEGDPRGELLALEVVIAVKGKGGARDLVPDRCQNAAVSPGNDKRNNDPMIASGRETGFRRFFQGLTDWAPQGQCMPGVSSILARSLTG